MVWPTRDTLPLTAVPPAEVEDESPAIAALADPLNWARMVERKAVVAGVPAPQAVPA